MIDLIAGSAFVTTVLLVWGIYAWVTTEERNLGWRLWAFAVRPWNPAEASGRPPDAPRRAPVSRLLRRVEILRPLMGRLEGRLVAAGVMLRPEEFLAIDALAVLAGGGFLWVLTKNAAGLVLGAALGLIGPWASVHRSRTVRLARCEQQILSVLTVMINSLRAGHSFMSAVQAVAEEVAPPLGEEFARTLREIRLGSPVEDALGRLTERVASPDLDLIVTAALIQRKVGGNLAEILDRISHTVRGRLRVKGVLRTVTAQARLSAGVVSALPVGFAALLAVLDPTMFGMLTGTPVGNLLLVLALVLEVTGVFVVRKIVDIKA